MLYRSTFNSELSSGEEVRCTYSIDVQKPPVDHQEGFQDELEPVIEEVYSTEEEEIVMPYRKHFGRKYVELARFKSEAENDFRSTFQSE